MTNDEIKAFQDERRRHRERSALGPRPLVVHIRRRIVTRRGSTFYRDKTDYTDRAATLCGAPTTYYDLPWNTRRRSRVCPDCLAKQ